MVLIKDFRLKHFRFYVLFFWLGFWVFFFFFKDGFQLKCFRVLKNTRCPAHKVSEEPESLPLPPREVSCCAEQEQAGMARSGSAGAEKVPGQGHGAPAAHHDRGSLHERKY